MEQILNIYCYKHIIKYLTIDDTNNLGKTCTTFRNYNVILYITILYDSLEFYHNVKNLVTHIQCSNYNIKDITLVSKFINIEYLYCINTSIKNFTILKSLTHLHTLHLDVSNLDCNSDCNIFKCTLPTNLKKFYLKVYRMFNLQFLNNLLHLTNLHIESELDTEDALFNCRLPKTLKVLFCKLFSITNFTFVESLPNLCKLYIHSNIDVNKYLNNDITNLSTCKFPKNIELLSCRGYIIKDFTFITKMTKLRKLYIDYDSYINIDYNSNINITELPPSINYDYDII